MLLAVVTAGVIWGLFNASLGMVFGFGPAMLVERGWSVAAASSATSIVLWLAVISVPMGGLLADWTGRRDAVLLGGLLANAVVLTIASRTQAVMPAFVALGLVSGISAGPIMSLPAQVLKPETRAVGMGIFFALFYLLIVLGPWLGGLLANSLGSARVTFDLGVAMLVACCVALWLFRRLVEAPSGAAISA